MTVEVANILHFVPFLMQPAGEPQAKPPLVCNGFTLQKQDSSVIGIMLNIYEGVLKAKKVLICLG